MRAAIGLGDDNLLTARRETEPYQRYSRDEEREMFRRMQAGDMGARDELIMSCVPWVINRALGYSGRGIDDEDLVQCGLMGLTRAVDRFDLEKGCRLTTYATKSILREVWRELNCHTYLIKLPEHPGNSRAIREGIERVRAGVKSLDAIRWHDHESWWDKDGTQDDDGGGFDLPDGDQHSGITPRIDLLHEMIDRLLKPKHGKIVCLRMQGLTYQKIADHMELSKERIRQILDCSVNILRQAWLERSENESLSVS